MCLRVGIVGCGLISRFHALAIAETPGVELAGCASHSPESARQFGVKYGCKAFDSVPALIDNSHIDAVAICSPSGAHLAPALMAIKAGKHVMIEKPLEISPSRCDQIINAALANGVQVATVFQSRFSPVWQRLKTAIGQNRLGTLAIGDAHVKWFRPQSYYDSAAWRGTWKLDGGGALMNQGIHTVDLLLWLMGPVRRVSAFVATRAHERIEVEDVAVASLEFADGALGTISVTTASHPGIDKRIEIHGSRGSAIVDEDKITHWVIEGESESKDSDSMGKSGIAGSGASDPAGISHALHAAQYADFAESISAGRAPFVDGHEGRKSVALIDTIYRSARENRIISLE